MANEKTACAVFLLHFRKDCAEMRIYMGENKKDEKKAEGGAQQKKEKKRDKKLAALIFVLIAAAAAFAALLTLYMKYAWPSEKKVSRSEYFDVDDDDQTALIFEKDVVADAIPIKKDGYWYLSFSSLYYNVCNAFYYDGFSLLYTDPTQTYSASPGEYGYTDGDDISYTLDYQPCYFGDDGLYVSLDYLQLMDFSYYTVNEDGNFIWINDDWSDALQTKTTEATQLRAGAALGEHIVAELSAGDRLFVLEQSGSWCKAQNDTGLVGWVQTKKLSDIELLSRGVPDGRPLPEYTSMTMDETVVMGWHQVFNKSGVDELSDIIDTAKGMNVICPTWFTLSDDSGNFTNLGEIKYVERAHKAGLKVWVLLENINEDVDELKIFGTTENRKNLVQQLVEAVEKLGADGVNIDIENLTEDTASSYIQFLRELGAACRNAQLVLSVDNYSPMPHTSFYDRTQQGEILDYVVVMAYDEHWQYGEEAGTSSSVSFVEQSAERTIEQVPKEKVIVGLPFYSRIWCEAPVGEGESGAVTVDNTSGTYDSKYEKYELSSKGVNMEGEKSFIKKNSLSLTWNDETSQYYTEYKDGNKYYRLWVEDDKSIDFKMQAAMSYEPAGVAFFSLGGEDAETWTIIRKYLN